MEARRIADMEVFPIGFGSAGLTLRPVDDAVAVRTIRAAVDAGVSLFDTAACYSRDDAPRHGEALLGRILGDLGPERERIVVATKGGHLRLSATDWPIDARPDALRRDCDESLRRLGQDTIGLYQLNWPDPDVPIEESVGALGELRAVGKVRAIGLSNVSVDQVRRAVTVTEIASVQNHFSFGDRTVQPVLDYCTANGIAFLCHSPFGGVSGAATLVGRWPSVDAIAARLGATAHQIALAWVIGQSPIAIALPGPTRVVTATEAAAAAAFSLTDADRAALARAARGE